MGEASKLKATWRTSLGSTACITELSPLVTVGTESMQWSAREVSLALKFPATMLQSSPIASLTMLGSLAVSSPAIFVASLMAVSEEQRMVVMLQRAPAVPTMAVRPDCSCETASAPGSAAGGTNGVRRVPAIISKTSGAAQSRTDF